MGKFDRYGDAPGSRPSESEVESKMEKILTPDRESYRRVEPILDASGSLKRHTLSRLDRGRTRKQDGTGSEQTGED